MGSRREAMGNNWGSKIQIQIQTQIQIQKHTQNRTQKKKPTLVVRASDQPAVQKIRFANPVGEYNDDSQKTQAALNGCANEQIVFGGV